MNKRIKVREYWCMAWPRTEADIKRGLNPNKYDKSSERTSDKNKIGEVREAIRKWRKQFPVVKDQPVLLHVTVYKKDMTRTLKELREEAGLTIEQLSDKSMIPEDTMTRMETTNYLTNAQGILNWIVKALGYEIEYYAIKDGKRYKLVDPPESEG